MQNYVELFSAKVTGLAESFVEAAPKIIAALVVFGIFFGVSKIVSRIVAALLNKFDDSRALSKVLSRISGIVVTALGLLIAAGIIFPSVTTANILGLLGVGSVAIGFAFKDIFQNFLAGMLILALRAFRIGDQIIVDSIEGTVEDIQIRATILRTYDNRQVIIPNATIFSNTVTVLTAYDKRRVSVTMGIGYGDDTELAKKIILSELAKVDGILKDPAPYVLIVGYGGSSVDLEVRFWLAPPRRFDLLQLQDAALSVIKPALFAAGIDLPFPTQQILLHDQTEETDGDRSRQREGWPAGKDVPKSRWSSDRAREEV